MPMNTCTFLGSGLCSDHDIVSPNNSMFVCLDRPFSLVHFRLAFLHIHRTLLSVASWSLHMSLNPTLRMSSKIPNTLSNP